MTFPTPRLEDWRALVDKELAGRPFDKVLVHKLVEGLAVDPLYVAAPVEATAARIAHAGFRICIAGDDVAELADGADALWTKSAALLDETDALLVFDDLPVDALKTDRRVLLGHDPIDRGAAVTFPDAKELVARAPSAVLATVSTLAYHEAGADAADEIEVALSTGAAYLGALVDAGLVPDEAARQVSLRVAVGRDTFVELAKLRALRVCWQKLLAAFGASGQPIVHAVASRRTLSGRDPWVNMLRVTTQVFAAAVGGADLVTPQAFDAALGEPSALGRRVARNTGLVLREESFLGRIGDASGGSYYFESLTDALAREGWKRFQQMEKAGGIAKLRADGTVAKRLEDAWHDRLRLIATRRTPLLGVSEFANLDEQLPAVAPATVTKGDLPVHRDTEAFEALRTRADATRPEALLLTVGTFAESRGRVGFATSFLAAGGIRAKESSEVQKTDIAIVCGTDERYATDAVATVKALKEAGARRVLLAGKPGALEASLKEAGLDGSIFVGCDALATLADLLGDEA